MYEEIFAAPLLDADWQHTALVEPGTVQPTLDVPDAAVACFFPEIIPQLTVGGRAIVELPSTQWFWEIDHAGERLGIFYPGLGAPLASYCLELVIATGCRRVVACGGAGALSPELPMGHHVITVTSALRDEGTSYHYLPPSDIIEANKDVAETLTAVVIEADVPYLTGRTWTTDGIFRETLTRVSRRKGQGCITVEMEAAALIAVAKYRKIKFGQYLYAGDDLSGTTWDNRSWKQATDMRRLLVNLAARAALRI